MGDSASDLGSTELEPRTYPQPPPLKCAPKLSEGSQGYDFLSGQKAERVQGPKTQYEVF